MPSADSWAKPLLASWSPVASASRARCSGGELPQQPGDVLLDARGRCFACHGLGADPADRLHAMQHRERRVDVREVRRCGDPLGGGFGGARLAEDPGEEPARGIVRGGGCRPSRTADGGVVRAGGRHGNEHVGQQLVLRHRSPPHPDRWRAAAPRSGDRRRARRAHRSRTPGGAGSPRRASARDNHGSPPKGSATDGRP